jgi:hypothetical protein
MRAHGWGPNHRLTESVAPSPCLPSLAPGALGVGWDILCTRRVGCTDDALRVLFRRPPLPEDDSAEASVKASAMRTAGSTLATESKMSRDRVRSPGAGRQAQAVATWCA